MKHASGTVASMGGWKIHAARPGDGAGIVSLHLAGGNDYLELDPTRFRIPDEDGLAEWLDGDLESSGGSWICFVAEEDGRIVGEVEAKLRQPMESARYFTRPSDTNLVPSSRTEALSIWPT